MIIDETFMWLYTAYKFGQMCFAPFSVACFASIISIMLYVEPMEKSAPIAVKIWKISAYVIPISLCFGLITPSENELKAYAAYAIGKDVTTSDEAKRLFNAAINYIEGQTTKVEQ